MTRSESRLILAVGLTMAVLPNLGCNKSGSSGAAAKQVPVTKAVSTESPTTKPKLFADWRGLEAVLILTGEMNGYLDPCGCTKGQLGGLGRRYDLFDKMREANIPFIKIDLGGLMKDPASERGGMEQAKIKFDTALKALSMMKYDAIGLGVEDLKLGIMHTLSVFLNLKDTLNFVCANAAFSKDLGGAFDGTLRPFVLTTAGPYKVGITSVLDPALYDVIKDPERGSLELKPPETVLPEVVAQLKDKADIQVLLVQGSLALAQKLAEANPSFQIVVCSSDVDDPDTRPMPINNGATQLIRVGHKGKYVGALGLLASSKGKSPEMKYEMLSLVERNYKNAEPMRVLIDEEMQSQLKALGIVENFTRHANVEAPAGSTYVGAIGCKSCHPNTYARWTLSKHAKAYEPLINNPNDPKRKRQFDAECISCHTTGFSYNSGWVSEEKTPYLKGNQCENCHGPSSKHVADPDNVDFRKAIARTSELADKGGLCVKCHDADNSHDYNFGTYYGQIVHKAMDDYKDPRTHKKGMTPEQARAAR